ncbi:hypothetical protein [Pseudolabrys sp.]|uniref:phage major capsid protein n=1 Tax=Pseudolabrys sp. TaxID=1960880 RepID=UPI003D0E00F9
MAFPVASGATTPAIYPAGSSGNNLSGTGFIPEIWSGKLVEKFYASTVLGAISNTDYEGEIRNQGDKVKIRTKPTITINDYKADGVLALQRPTGNVIELAIDQGKYFSTILDDVMDVQSDLNMLSMWSDDAAEQMKIKIDTAVLLGILGQANSANRGATAGAITGALNLGVTSSGPLALVANTPGNGEVEILDAILRLGQALDEQNIPETGRWIVMPTWAGNLVKRSELRQAYLSGDGVSILRNGRLGMVDRFTLYTSNLMPSGTAAGLSAGEYVIYAGHAHGLTFASQMTKMETLRSEMTFGQILRGLQVYGYKVVDGTALAQAIVTKA